MAAPAHNPARNSDWAIRLTPRIVVDPNYSVVQPNVAQPNITPNPPAAAPTSFEDAQQRAFDQGRQFERGGARMADAKKDEHGHHWHPPGWLNTLILAVVFGVIALVTINWFVNNVDRTVNPQGYYARQQQDRIDALTAENDRLRGSGAVVNGGGRTAGSARGNAGGYRSQSLPSPRDVNRAAYHRRERVSVDCDTEDGFARVAGSNRCAKTTWVPGEDDD